MRFKIPLILGLAIGAASACDSPPAGREMSQCALWLECYSECRHSSDLHDEDEPVRPWLPEDSACVAECEGIGQTMNPNNRLVLDPNGGGEATFGVVADCLTGALDFP